MKNNQVQDAMQRAKQYWYVDGLNEIALGFVFLLLGVYFWLQAILPADSIFTSLLTAGSMLLIVFWGWLASRLVQWAKRRLTYPRTGYVSYRQPPTRNRWIAAFVAMVLGSLLVALLSTSPQALLFIHTLSGIIVGVVFLYIGARQNLIAYQILALISIVIGASLTWLGLSIDLGSALYYLPMGLVIALTGAIKLIHYLQNTEPDRKDDWEPQL